MNKTVATLQTCVAILSLTAALTLQANPAGHYRWKDSEGNVHYSDRPPEGVESEFIKFATGKRSKPPVQKSQSPSNGVTDGATSSEIEGRMEILPEKDPKLCKQAQANLSALDGARIRITDPDGTQRFLTEEQKEEQRINARKFIKLHCD